MSAASDRESATTPQRPSETPSSVWPFALAGGIALLIFGFGSTWAFTVAGVVLMAVAIGGWIGELRR